MQRYLKHAMSAVGFRPADDRAESQNHQELAHSCLAQHEAIDFLEVFRKACQPFQQA